MMTTDMGVVQLIASAKVQQQAYRKILHAFSYPGRIQTLDLNNCESLWILLATLVDEGVTLADEGMLIPTSLHVYFDSPRQSAQLADFVVIDASQPLVEEYQPRTGSIYDPHEGATLLWRCKQIGAGTLDLVITGPGVADQNAVTVEGVHSSWLAARERWVGRFPMGVDIIVCDQERFFALPRTSNVHFTSSR